MKSLTNLFKSIKTMLNKIDSAKRPNTKVKYQEKLQKKLTDVVNDRSWKQDLLKQNREAKEHAFEEKRLRDAVKNQKRFDYERRRHSAKFRKLRQQQDLSKRLLSEGERSLLLRRKFTQGLSSDELNEINKRLLDNKREQIRQKKLVKRQKKDMKNPEKRRSLNERYSYLNELSDSINVEQNDETTKLGTMKGYNIISRKNTNTTFTDYIEASRSGISSILRGHNNITRHVKLKIEFTLVRYDLLTGEVEERVSGKFLSTNFLQMFPANDLNDLFTIMKNDLISKFLDILLAGSG